MGTIAFLGIPGWIPQTILPITFGIMAFRFFLQAFKNLSMILTSYTKSDYNQEK
jgi:TRAP-type C4-dicarboxylate transport system permease small subunit